MANKNKKYTDMNTIMEILFEDSDGDGDSNLDIDEFSDTESIIDYEEEELRNGIQALRKTYKWYKKLVFRLILQCSLNAHKVCAHTINSNASYLDFLLSNLKLIFALTPEIPRNPRIAIGEDFDRLTGRHFPSMIAAGNAGSNDRPHKRCRVCYTSGKRTTKGHPLKTVYICRFCPSQPGLHPDKCFEAYHTLLDYAILQLLYLLLCLNHFFWYKQMYIKKCIILLLPGKFPILVTIQKLEYF